MSEELLTHMDIEKWVTEHLDSFEWESEEVDGRTPYYATHKRSSDVKLSVGNERFHFESDVYTFRMFHREGLYDLVESHVNHYRRVVEDTDVRSALGYLNSLEEDYE